MKLVKRIAIAVAGILLLGLVILYGGSEWVIRTSHAVPLAQIAVPKDAASIQEGGRLAKLFGCRSCHGLNAEGRIWDGPPWFVASISPPPIAAKIANYSDAELLRLIRHGIKKDGTSLYVMATISQQHIADDDMGRLIAWLRTVKPGPKDVGTGINWGPVGRLGALTGQFKPSFQAGDVAPKQRPADIGRYFVDTMCSECHTLDTPKPNDNGQVAPALASTVASYDPAAFKKLMRTGVGMSNRDLGLMKEIGQEAAYALSDEEIAAIQAYLTREAEKQPAK
jgi:cytochrome c553